MNLEKMTDHVIKNTDDTIKKYGPRLAGTKESLDTANDLYERAKKISDNAYIEDFNINKGAFLGWIRILVFNYLVSVTLMWFNLHLIALILSFISVLILIFQFILYLPVIDFLFPKHKAKNVYGVIEPKEKVEKQIIVSGHHDSAYIFNFFINKPHLYNLRTTGGIGLIVGIGLLNILPLIFRNNYLILAINIVPTVGLFLVLQMWFFRSKKGTPGAGDNLIATNVAFEIGKYFYNLKEENKGLKNTRLIFASFDAEEEGLRGARAFVKRHLKSMEDIKTYVLNADCLYDENELFFLTSDLNDTVKLDNKFINELLETSKKLNLKVKTQKQAFLTGGTDAAEFGKKNISATTLIGMPWTNKNRSLVYHTPSDTIDSVNRKAVTDSLNLFITYIKDKDIK